MELKNLLSEIAKFGGVFIGSLILLHRSFMHGYFLVIGPEFSSVFVLENPIRIFSELFPILVLISLLLSVMLVLIVAFDPRDFMSRSKWWQAYKRKLQAYKRKLRVHQFRFRKKLKQEKRWIFISLVVAIAVAFTLMKVAMCFIAATGIFGVLFSLFALGYLSYRDRRRSRLVLTLSLCCFFAVISTSMVWFGRSIAESSLQESEPTYSLVLSDNSVKNAKILLMSDADLLFVENKRVVLISRSQIHRIIRN